MTKRDPFKYFHSSPEIIRLAVMMYVRFPLSLRNVEDLLHERGIDISHETVRFWWLRFGPIFAAEIRKRRIEGMRSSHWRWHLDEMFVPTTGAGNASVPTHAKVAEIRLRPRFCLEPLQSGTQPLKSTSLQGQPHRRPCRVAPSLRGIRGSVTVLVEMG